MQTKTTNAGPH